MKVNRSELGRLYTEEKWSAKEIADKLQVNESSIRYYLEKYEVPIRSVSEAIYLKHNNRVDPFRFFKPKTKDDFQLWGLGLALYWGEGNRMNRNVVRVGNSDPAVIRKFIDFLDRFFGIDHARLRFHLHLFTDIDINVVSKYWQQELEAEPNQFYKPTVTLTGKLGTYRAKSQYGVATLYYANTKIRNFLVASIAEVAQG